MINLDEEKLHSFLQERKSKIHGPQISYDGIFATLTFLFTMLTVDYSKTKIFDNSIVVAIFWIAFGGYTIYQIVKIITAINSNYTAEDLYNDIKKLEKGSSNFSLVIIKDSMVNHQNKILLAYDKRWKCYLLPYFRTIDDKQKDEQEVKNFIERNLNISNENITVKLVRESETTKFSESNQRTKTYNHRFYTVSVSKTDDIMTKKVFKYNSKKYRWYTIEEMLQNRNMKKKNQDIIEELKEIHF